MFMYETHLHTSPVSRCADKTVRESLEFYKKMGYEGVFITNHFIDANIGIDKSRPYAEKIEFYFSDYEQGLIIGKEIGLKVFCGIETTYQGADFLVYGLDKAWFLAHPEIMDMKKSEQLLFFIENGALVIHAHPFREASYIDHIKLYPRCVHGVEVINTCRTDFENKMAKMYAESYNLLEFAGSDAHHAENHEKGKLAGMCSDTPIENENDFILRVKNNEMQIFTKNIN